MSRHDALIPGLGPWACLAVVVASSIGTGVFLKAPGILCQVGSPWGVLAAWLAAGLLSLAGAAVYAELAASMPRAGGEYAFMKEAFGPLAGFMYGWMRFFIANSSGQAALVLGLASFLEVAAGRSIEHNFYETSAFGKDLAFGMKQVVGLAAIAVAGGLGLLSVKVNGRVAVVLAVVKVAVAAGVIVAALVWGQAPVLSGHVPEAACKTRETGFTAYGAALLGALWAYNGWYSLTLLSEEVRAPGKDIPRALIGGVALVVVLYLLLNLGYFFLLNLEAIARVAPPHSVVIEGLRHVLPPAGVVLLAVLLALSTFGALHIAILSNARVAFAMSRDGLLFPRYGKLSEETGVPTRALKLQSKWTAILVVSGSFDQLTDTVMFGTWIFYALAAVALFVLRKKRPDLPRPYRVWAYPWLPAGFIAGALVVLVSALLVAPKRSLLGLGMLLLGFPLHAAWRWYERRRRPKLAP